MSPITHSTKTSTLKPSTQSYLNIAKKSVPNYLAISTYLFSFKAEKNISENHPRRFKEKNAEIY